ncbi:arsenate reductase family protein [uncultured Psychroserpens sp.]|uniref:arsenate reductase family protein n=1 Tax=uncultured Psychroserpens sp. TaxID=255436 RepID=UPI0026332B85|nr:ArsC/Spx/MgsR family protein [uncultured Psychroserpens sp.]
MNIFYYLKSCSTCIRIIKTLNLPEDVALREIKSNPITESELEKLKDLAGSFEALFSKRAQLYKSQGLKDKKLTEVDFKTYILKHYTFLKRPVLVYNGNIFIGNTSKTVDAAKVYIHLNE